MKINIAPKTSSGKWAIGFIFALILFLAVFWVLIALGQQGGATFFSNPALAVPMLLAGISGVAAFVAGLFGIIKDKERSVLVFLAGLIGLFVLIFWLGEIITPH